MRNRIIFAVLLFIILTNNLKFRLFSLDWEENRKFESVSTEELDILFKYFVCISFETLGVQNYFKRSKYDNQLIY